jgi:hypothetical protein
LIPNIKENARCFAEKIEIKAIALQFALNSLYQINCNLAAPQGASDIKIFENREPHTASDQTPNSGSKFRQKGLLTARSPFGRIGFA